MLNSTNRTCVLIALLFYLFPSVLKTSYYDIDIRALESETFARELKPYSYSILDLSGLLNSPLS